MELAGQLDNNPAKLYVYVRDEVEYIPYYGYMKESLRTLWEGRGNDMDQVVLLSDLLRSSGYLNALYSSISCWRREVIFKNNSLFHFCLF
jgi:hypothetical protein